VREIFRNAFAAAGLPYFNPHSFRDTLVQLGERACPSIEAFKAWSQNMGHERVMTTLTSYGTVAPHRQAELIRGMKADKRRMEPAEKVDPAMVAKVMAAMMKVAGDGMN
jgi:integrase